jgi:hypothetical protein
MRFEILENQESKNFVKENENFKNILKDPFIIEWLEENNVKLYLLFNNENVLVSFGMSTVLKKDPLKTHVNPVYLNYIYTFENYRRKNYAYHIACELKKIENITVFCTDDISQNLFKKADYIFKSKDPLYQSLPIYRFP